MVMSTEPAGTAASGQSDPVTYKIAEIYATPLADQDLKDLLRRVANLAVDFFPSCDAADIILFRDHKAMASGFRKCTSMAASADNSLSCRWR